MRTNDYDGDRSSVGDHTITIGASTTVEEAENRFSDPRRRKTKIRLSKQIDVTDEEAEQLAFLTDEQKEREIKRLNTLIGQYKLILYSVAITVGWAAYATNMTIFYTKNVLNLSPEATTRINSIAFLPWSVKPLWGFLVDSVFPFRYRFKSHTTFVSLFNCLVMAVLIYQPKPHKDLLTVVLFLQIASISYIDSMAQGMTAMITKLIAKVKALEDPDSTEVSPLRIFALYTSVKNLVRCVMTFVGGIIVERTAKSYLLVSGFAQASCPLVLCLLTLFVFREQRKSKVLKGCDDFVTGMKKTGQSVFVKKAMGPYLIVILYQFIPQMPQIYTYMLLSTGGWSFDLFSFSTLIGSLVTNLFLMFGFPRVSKFVKAHYMMLAILVMLALCLLLSSSVLTCGNYNPDLYSIFWTGASSSIILANVLILVVAVGRISPLLPAGFESIGIAVTTSIVNMCTSAGQFLGAELASAYNVKAGYYGRMMYPQITVVVTAIALIGISPWFLSYKKD